MFDKQLWINSTMNLLENNQEKIWWDWLWENVGVNELNYKFFKPTKN